MSSAEKQILERLREARDAYMKRQYPKAIESYKWVEAQIQDDPANLPVIQIELGWSYYSIKDFRNAIASLQKAHDSSSITAQQRFDCLRLIGFSYQSIGETEKALDFLDQAQNMDIPEPDKKYIYFEIGKLRFLQGALIQSKVYLHKALNLFDWGQEEYYRALLYYLGFVAFYEKQFDRAEQHFSEIARKATKNNGKAAGYFGIAHLLYENGDYEQLANTCKRILEFDADFYDKETIAFFMTKSYLELGRDEEFRIFFDELLRQYPDGRYRSYYPVFQEKLLRIKTGK